MDKLKYSFKAMKKATSTLKQVLVILVWLTAAIDIFTFYYIGKIIYETNPVYLMTGSAAITITLKLIIIAALSILLLKAFPLKIKFKSKLTNSFFKAAEILLIIVAILLIIMQIKGAIDNLTITSSSQPLPKEEAISIYLTRYFIPYIIIISLVVLLIVYFVWVKKKG